ncbi:PREDICTED: stromelysin-2 [Elephantulus edwardii]|uniref:stromelysin-2 n=1 Tax=Elephantulus edwardii TaxID=28737 RepID=UPI0003F0B402|nr:PREDICTED: stromelysin-2 [Elephantulus edwardii]
MENLVICVLLCLPACLAYPLNKTVKKEPNIDLVQKYLENDHDLGNDVKEFVRRNGSSAVVKKTQEIQRSPGLKVMEKWDSDTLQVMHKTICGVPNVSPISRYPGLRKWRKTNLTYRIVNYIPKLSRNATDFAIEKALKLWEVATPLMFSRLYDGEADIMISFMSRDHKDYGFFDIPAFALAHAFSPGPGLRGDIHFYDDIQWTEDYSGTNFLLVAAHEVGHALGLFHSNDPDALMYTFYKKPTDPSLLCLSQDDVNNIQSLYGPPPSSTDNTTAPTESIPTQSQPPAKCDPDLSFDAVTAMRGEIIFFKDKYFWQKNHSVPAPILYSISSHWPSLPSKLDAAYEAHAKDTVFVFKGNQFWAMKLLEMQADYPRSIYTLGFPPTVQKIDAAFSDKDNRKTYFFIKEKYWRFDEDSQSMDQGFPRLITEDFPGVEQKIDAVFQNSGLFYFFSGPSQIEFDPNAKMVTKRVRGNSWLASKSDNLFLAQTEDYVHIRIQQRNGRKVITTVQGIADDYNKKKLGKVFRKNRPCNGPVLDHPEYGEVIQLQGDRHKNTRQFFVETGLAKDDQLFMAFKGLWLFEA